MAFCKPLMAENLSIESSTISIDKKEKITVFKGNVFAIDAKKMSLKLSMQNIKKNQNYLKVKVILQY